MPLDNVYPLSFSGVRLLNVTLGDGATAAAMSVDVLESCSAAEMFSDCRAGDTGGVGGVASTCEWAEAEWKRRSGELMVSIAVHVVVDMKIEIFDVRSSFENEGVL